MKMKSNFLHLRVCARTRARAARGADSRQIGEPQARARACKDLVKA